MLKSPGLKLGVEKFKVGMSCNYGIWDLDWFVQVGEFRVHEGLVLLYLVWINQAGKNVLTVKLKFINLDSSPQDL